MEMDGYENALPVVCGKEKEEKDVEESEW